MKHPFVPSAKWYKLDYSSDIYPMSSTQTTMSIFRMSVEMRNYVDGENLTTALKDIMPRFPTFAVMLRRGFFRYYFEANSNTPVAFADDGLLLYRINQQVNKRFLFRVQYYKKRISVDFFHGLCDGTGAMDFLKALIYRYLDECGEELPEHGDIKIVEEQVPEVELEDSIRKYSSGFDMFGGVVGKMAGRNCFGIKGKRFKTPGYGLIQGYVKTDELKALAKSLDCTITALIAGAVLLAITRTHVKDTEKAELVAMVPINLRKYFPSQTVRNFTTLTKCYVRAWEVEHTLEAYAKVCKQDLINGLKDKDELRQKISVSALMATNKFLKYVPVFLKELGTKIGKLGTTKTKQTLILSNLGVIDMPECVGKHVKRFGFSVNVSKKVPNNVGVISFGGTTSICFTRNLVSTEIEREFFSILRESGIVKNIEITSNLREIR
jgi:hypothetical protein